MKKGGDRQIHLMSHKSLLNHYHLFNYCNFCLQHLLLSDLVIVSVGIKPLFLGSLLCYLIWLHGLCLMQISIYFIFFFWWNQRQISKSNAHMSTNVSLSHARIGMLEHPFSSPRLSFSFCFSFFHPSFYAHTLFRLIRHQPAGPPSAPPPTTSSVHVRSKTWPLMSLLFQHPEWAFIISPPLPELRLLYTFTTLNWLRPFHPHATGTAFLLSAAVLPSTQSSLTPLSRAVRLA